MLRTAIANVHRRETPNAHRTMNPTQFRAGRLVETVCRPATSLSFAVGKLTNSSIRPPKHTWPSWNRIETVMPISPPLKQSSPMFEELYFRIWQLFPQSIDSTFCQVWTGHF